MKQRIFKAPKGYLQEKVIAVTGASDGIGAVAAKTFASYGATIILIGRSVPKLEKVYDEIEADGGPTPGIYPICFEKASEKTILSFMMELLKFSVVLMAFYIVQHYLVREPQ